ncbi:MAG: hypothetical protein Q7S96_02540 [bacterium]|nr:hypothetical protein [bacterium]
MDKLENIFIGFRNSSFDEIIKLNLNHTISNKEKLIFRTIFENSANLIASFIKEIKASKSIEEKDFDWMMLLYVFVCVQELHDILDRVEKTDDAHIKNTLDVNKQDLINHLKKILGGKDMGSVVDKTFNHIESSDKESGNYNEFVVGRTYVIFSMLKENQVNIENMSSEKLLQISEENYKNSIVNFVKICV